MLLTCYFQQQHTLFYQRCAWITVDRTVGDAPCLDCRAAAQVLQGRAAIGEMSSRRQSIVGAQDQPEANKPKRPAGQVSGLAAARAAKQHSIAGNVYQGLLWAARARALLAVGLQISTVI